MQRHTLKEFITFILFVIIILSFESCGPGGSTTISSDYKDAKFVNAGVAICFPKRELLVENGSDVTKDLGPGDSSEVFYSFFNDQLKKELFTHTTFSRVVPLTYQYEAFYDKKFSWHTLEDGNGKPMKMYLPLDGTSVDTKSDSVRFILFIEAFKTWRISGRDINTQQNANVGIAVGHPLEVLPGDKLAHTLKYTLWDNEKGAVVVNGKIGEGDEFTYDMKKSNWESVVTSIVKEMFARSSFGKK